MKLLDSELRNQKIELNLYGMTCANCASRIEKKLRNLNGVHDVSINLALEIGNIACEQSLEPEVILTTIEKMGYGVSLRKSAQPESSSPKKDIQRNNLFNLIFCSLLSIPLIPPMFIHSSGITNILSNPILQLLLSFPVVFIFGRRFHKNAILTLKDLSPGMDTLVSLGTISAFSYSIYLAFFTNYNSHLYFETASLLITFVLLGKYLEDKAKQKTNKAIEKLIGLRPKKVLVLRDGKEVSIEIDQLNKGDISLIKPGDSVPSDGIIIEGISEIDETMLTGESKPVFKKKGDTVYGGTLSISGFITIQITSIGENTVLKKIIKYVSEAQSSKAPIQRLADRISFIFVPTIIFLSLSSLFLTYFFLNPGDIQAAFEHSLSVLVIACPCALGLATPASIIAGSGRAAEYGILFKNSEALENAHKCDTIIFDKTGTLTKGLPFIENIIPVTDISKEEIFKYTAIAEKFSPHPFGKAIVSQYESQGMTIPNPEQFEYIPGMGIVAQYMGQIIKTGSFRILRNSDINIYSNLTVELEKKGYSIVYVYLNESLIGYISIIDQVKENSYQLIQNLKNEGREIYLLSGDKKETTQYIGELLNIENIIAEVKPEEKSSVVRLLTKQGKKVMMIGDGINDSPALATANIGIAMGNGSDIAIESADVTLLKSRIEGISELLFFSKITYLNIKQNLFWALCYNVIGIPLAFFGFLPPWLAGMAMALSSVSVVLNSLRLQNSKPRSNKIES